MPKQNTVQYLGRKLGEILVSLGKLEQEDLESVLIAQKNTSLRLGEFLLQRGAITEDDLLTALSYQLGIGYHPDLLKDSGAVLSSNLPHGFIRRNNIVILKETDDTIEIATNDASQTAALENIKSMTGKEVVIVLAKKLDILRIADLLAGEESESADKVIEGLQTDREDITILGETEETEQDVLDLANEAPIIKLVNLMITEALKERASDIHVEPSEEGITIRYRIDGILYNALSPPKRYQQAIVSRVKIMANMNIAENRLPQDGRIKVKYGTSDVDIRVSTIPSVVGERVVMRLLVKDDRRFDLNKLGMDERFLKSFREMLNIPHGIVIVSGPTGSGKTTTLYAAIREINTPEKNIITIEDPVEYRIKGISQIQINPKINLTFAAGLRSILRQDPEVIMVGEIRDRETAEIAIQAAMTGHLVFSTVHTNDAASAVVRLLDMGVEPYLIASTATGLLSQRLVRVLCPSCKKPAQIDSAVLRHEGIAPGRFKGKKVFAPEGCQKCNDTGFFDRIGIYEMIKVDENVRKLIVDRRDASYIRERCSGMGMRTMQEDGLDKVAAGLTSIEEVLRVIRE
ncbi:MAG: type II secretion system ATPase GspE [Spirochaetes bacterium]|nr:type II secretion system ATPase GspE [Spirochaetota bacterium]